MGGTGEPRAGMGDRAGLLLFSQGSQQDGRPEMCGRWRFIETNGGKLARSVFVASSLRSGGTALTGINGAGRCDVPGVSDGGNRSRVIRARPKASLASVLVAPGFLGVASLSPELPATPPLTHRSGSGQGRADPVRR